jgi:uncharacterized RDD family membrane protein YckC
MEIHAFGGTMQDGELPSSWPGSRARLAAFAVDSLILELIGVLVGMLHLDTLAAPSTMTRVSGIFLILGYYGILCSRVGGGQTFGMKLFTFRVVGDDGKPLELLRSLARALVLCAPFLLNGIIFNGYSSNADLGLLIVAGTIAFGAGLAQLSLLAFNRSSRRLLHDILLRSNAICIEHELPVTQGGPRLSRTSRALVGTSFSVALVAMTFLPILVATQHKDALLKNVQIAVQTLPGPQRPTARASSFKASPSQLPLPHS